MFGRRRLKRELEYYKKLVKAKEDKISELLIDINHLTSGDPTMEMPVRARYALLRRIEEAIWNGES